MLWVWNVFKELSPFELESPLEKVKEAQLAALEDAMKLSDARVLKECGFILTRTGKSSDTYQGLVIWSLEELQVGVELQSERGCTVIRRHDGIVSVDETILIPVSLQGMICGELVVEIATIAVEWYTQRNLGSSMLFFTEDHYARQVSSLSDLEPDRAYTRPGNDVHLERTADGSVRFKFKCRSAQVPVALVRPVAAVNKAMIRRVPTSSTNEIAKASHVLRNIQQSASKRQNCVSIVDKENSATPIRPEKCVKGADLVESNQLQQPPSIESNQSPAAPIKVHAAVAAPNCPGGAPPPPPAPPPPTAAISNLSNNKRRMRTLHWKPIPQSQVDATIWAQLSPAKMHVNEEEIESLFGISPANLKASRRSLTTKKRAGASTDLPLLISFKRANNAGIVMSRIRGCNLQGSLFDLNLEQLRGLASLFPLTRMEMESCRNFTGNMKTLSPPEALFVSLVKIPRVGQKLNSAIFAKTAKQNIKDIRRNCVILEQACAELEDSDRFCTLLKVIYAVGSVLNRGSYLGNSVAGFKISSLLQLSQTKGKKNKTSVLQYIADQVQPRECCRFIEDMPSLLHASRVSIVGVQEELKLGRDNSECLQEELRLSEGSLFVSQFQKQAEWIEKALLEEQTRVDNVVEILRETVGKYGEDPDKMGSDEFFSTIYQFSCELISWVK